jgi:hypothetical protein
MTVRFHLNPIRKAIMRRTTAMLENMKGEKEPLDTVHGKVN